MGRKKKKPTKPWCWYCNREFDDEKILIQHQKAKHYKCHVCHKKLYTGPGLAIHCMQVHKEMIEKIPNGLPNRNSVDIEIYGMQGIPEEDVRDHEKNRGNDSSSSSSYIPPSSSSTGTIGLTSGLLPLTAGPVSTIHPQIPFPGMPLLPPGLPPGLPPSLPPGLPPLPPGAAPPIPGGHFPGHPPPAISINLPRKPLFPSASAIIAGQPTTSGLNSSNSGLNSSISGLNSSNSSAILSAPASISKPSSTTLTCGPVPPLPSSSSSSSLPSSSVAPLAAPSGSISTGNPMSRIVHPGEDVSLEELRARRPKYQKVKFEESRIEPSAGQLAQMPPGAHFPQGLPTGPPPGFHFPPPGFNGQLPTGPPPTLPPVGRRWDAPPPAQPTFASTFKPAY